MVWWILRSVVSDAVHFNQMCFDFSKSVLLIKRTFWRSMNTKSSGVRLCMLYLSSYGSFLILTAWRLISGKILSFPYWQHRWVRLYPKMYMHTGVVSFLLYWWYCCRSIKSFSLLDVLYRADLNKTQQSVNHVHMSWVYMEYCPLIVWKHHTRWPPQRTESVLT